MTKLEIKALTFEPRQLPRCDAAVTPHSWNENDTRCRCQAKVEINGRQLCRKHAGSYLLALHLGQEWIDFNGFAK